jgi:1,4-alpha-glucan branching enzyme
VKDLNTAYRAHPAMWELDSVAQGFAWIDANDAPGNTFSFLRFGSPSPHGRRPTLASIVNFSGAPHYDYRLGLPHPGRWSEILNTDAEQYGGSGVGNLGSVEAEAVPWHGQPYSALLTLPPLGGLWLEPDWPAEPAGATEPTRTTEPAATMQPAAADEPLADPDPTSLPASGQPGKSTNGVR